MNFPQRWISNWKMLYLTLPNHIEKLLRVFSRFVLSAVAFAAASAFAQSPDGTAARDHLLPLVVDGGGFRAFLSVGNVSEAANTCTLDLRGADLTAARFEANADHSTAATRMNFSFGANDTNMTLASRGSASLAFGYAKLECAEPVTMRALLTSSVNGTTTSIAAFEGARLATSLRLPVRPRLGALGLVVANDAGSEVNCSANLLDNTGTTLDGGNFDAPAQVATVRFLNDLVTVADDFGGAVHVSCDARVGLLGVPVSGALLSTLTAIAPDADASSTGSHVLPLVVDGGGFRSELVVTNLAEVANNCTLALHGAGLGIDRFTLPIPDSATFTLDGKDHELSLLSGGGGQLAYGYATLNCSEPVAARNLLTVDVRSRLAGMAQIPATLAASVFEYPVLPEIGRLALAFANDTGGAASCAVTLRGAGGRNETAAPVEVPAKSAAVRFIDDLFSWVNEVSTGVASVSCDPAVNGVALPISGGVFAALPPAIFAAAPPPSMQTGSKPSFAGAMLPGESGQFTVGEDIGVLTFPEATGGDAPLRYSLEPAVPGLTFDAGTRQWSGAPTEPGIFELVYKVEDVHGDSDQLYVPIYVRETTDTMPSFSGVDAPRDMTLQIGVAIEPVQLPAATGGNAPVFYFLLPEIPGMSFDAETRRLSGTPTSTGVYEMTYVAEDYDYEYDQLEFTVTVVVPASSATPLDIGGCADGAFVDDADDNPDLVADCRALVGFANGLIESRLIPPDNNIRQWGTDGQRKLNAWNGITVQDGRVTAVNLAYGELKGEMPTDLGRLGALTELALDENELSGAVPPEFADLASLRVLNLSSNRLSGDIPAALGRISGLRELNLDGNKFEGAIPGALGQLRNLETLNLSGNGLTGGIPSELGNLPALRSLSLENNMLSGTIPPQIGQLAALEELDLDSNSLEGSIPVELAGLSKLRTLSLSTNGLEGTVPTALGDLPSLIDLDLSRNLLSGTIPTALGDLSNLTRLDLSFNRFTGTVPEQLAGLENLRVLSLNYNLLRGAVPWGLRALVLKQPPDNLQLRIEGTLLTGFAPPPADDSDPSWSSDPNDNGNAVHHSVAWFQGPRMLEWDWKGERMEHQTPILGRWAAIAVTISHGVEQAPKVITRVLDAEDAVLHGGLAEAIPAVTTAAGDAQWRSEYVFFLPGNLFQADNKIVHVIDPDNELAETDETDNESPALTLYGEKPPTFRAVFVPVRFESQQDQDTQWIDALDAEQLMLGTRAFLPIAEDYTARIGSTMDSSASDIGDVLDSLMQKWNAEGDADEFYHAIVNDSESAGQGIAFLGGQVAVSSLSPHVVIPHEFGHNLNLEHTPGCFAAGADPDYPYEDGRLGPEPGWERNWLRFVSGAYDEYRDVMSYCGEAWFISGYNYKLASRYWLAFNPQFGTGGTGSGRPGTAEKASRPRRTICPVTLPASPASARPTVSQFRTRPTTPVSHFRAAWTRTVPGV